jgi:ribosomal protein S18 acetylase RimI-like enzyme
MNHGDSDTGTPIRPAREADLPPIVDCVLAFNRFICALAGKTPRKTDPTTFRQNLLTAMTDPQKIVIVAELDGVFAGYATGGIVNGDGVMETIFVREEYRRRAVGRDLMANVVTYLRGQGCSTARAEVLPQNPASEFYMTLGFRREGKFMVKDLLR